MTAYQEQIRKQEPIIEAIEKDGDKVDAQQALVKIYEGVCKEQPESDFLAQKLSNFYGSL